ncbi:MAG: ABC transporter permease [Deltaproteobacteria bacterium]|nr:ABC transporter permease [Deltaproteobacteria bacterium]
MGYELKMSWKHLRSRKRNGFLSVITYISIAGVALGVATLMLVMAVWTGYEKEIRNRILGISAHVVVLKYGPGFKLYREARKKVLKLNGVVAATPFMLRECMVSSKSKAVGALVKAVDPATVTGATSLAQNIKAGKGKIEWLFHPETMPGNDGGYPGIILGSEMARELGVKLGEKIEWISPLGGGITPSGPVPKGMNVMVAGIFHSGMYEYDDKFAFVTLKTAQDFFNTGDEVNGLDLKLADMNQADAVASRVLKVLGGYPYRTRTWMEMNRNLMSALKIEKTVSSILLLFIILVAAFNIVSTLILMVLDKGKEIAILKAIGATDGSIMKVFLYQGLVIGITGLVLGISAGYGLCVIAKAMNIGIDPSVYYLSSLPVEVQWHEMWMIVAAALFTSLLATLPPSWKAARLRPADGIRYE